MRNKIRRPTGKIYQMHKWKRKQKSNLLTSLNTFEQLNIHLQIIYNITYYVNNPYHEGCLHFKIIIYLFMLFSRTFKFV